MDCNKWVMGIGRHIIMSKVWDTLVLTVTCLPWHYFRMIGEKISKLPNLEQKEAKRANSQTHGSTQTLRNLVHLKKMVGLSFFKANDGKRF